MGLKFAYLTCKIQNFLTPGPQRLAQAYMYALFTHSCSRFCIFLCLFILGPWISSWPRALAKVNPALGLNKKSFLQLLKAKLLIGYGAGDVIYTGGAVMWRIDAKILINIQIKSNNTWTWSNRLFSLLAIILRWHGCLSPCNKAHY